MPDYKARGGVGAVMNAWRGAAVGGCDEQDGRSDDDEVVVVVGRDEDEGEERWTARTRESER